MTMVSESNSTNQSDKIANLPQVIYIKHLMEAFTYVLLIHLLFHICILLYIYKIHTYDVKISLEYANFLTKIKTQVR